MLPFFSVSLMLSHFIFRPFASPCMADGMAAFLNYFLLHLVGPKRRDLKVMLTVLLSNVTVDDYNKK